MDRKGRQKTLFNHSNFNHWNERMGCMDGRKEIERKRSMDCTYMEGWIVYGRRKIGHKYNFYLY